MTFKIVIVVTGILISPTCVLAQGNLDRLFPNLEHLIPEPSQTQPSGLIGLVGPNFGTQSNEPPGRTPVQIPQWPNQPEIPLNLPVGHIETGQSHVGLMPVNPDTMTGQPLPVHDSHIPSHMNPTGTHAVADHGPHGEVLGVQTGGLGEPLGAAFIHADHGPHGSSTGGLGISLGAASVHASKTTTHWDCPGTNDNFLDIPVEHVVADHGHHGNVHGSSTGGLGESLGAHSIHTGVTNPRDCPPKTGNLLDKPVEHVVADHGPHANVHSSLTGGLGEPLGTAFIHADHGPHGEVLGVQTGGLGEPLGTAFIHADHEPHGSSTGGLGESLGEASVHFSKTTTHWDCPGTNDNFLDIPVEHVVADHGHHGNVHGSSTGGLGESLGAAFTHAGVTNPRDCPPKQGKRLDVVVDQGHSTSVGQIETGLINKHTPLFPTGPIDTKPPRLSGSDYMSSLVQGYGRSRTKPTPKETLVSQEGKPLIHGSPGFIPEKPILSRIVHNTGLHVDPQLSHSQDMKLPSAVKTSRPLGGLDYMSSLANAYSGSRAKQTPVDTQISDKFPEHNVVPHIESISKPVSHLIKKPLGIESGHTLHVPGKLKPSELIHPTGRQFHANMGHIPDTAFLIGDVPDPHTTHVLAELHKPVPHNSNVPVRLPEPVPHIANVPAELLEPIPVSEPVIKLTKKQRKKLKKQKKKEEKRKRKQWRRQQRAKSTRNMYGRRFGRLRRRMRMFRG